MMRSSCSLRSVDESSPNRAGDSAAHRDRNAVANGLTLAGDGEWSVIQEADRQPLEPAHLLEWERTAAAVEAGGTATGLVALGLARAPQLHRAAPCVASDGEVPLERLKRDRLDTENSPIRRAEADATLAVLSATDLPSVQQLRVDAVAGNVGQRSGPNLFHNEPKRLTFNDNSLKFRDQIFVPRLKAVGPDHVHELREGLTRRPADHAIEAASGRVERTHVAAPQQVGPAHDAEALFLESSVKQANARKEGENQHLRSPRLGLSRLAPQRNLQLPHAEAQIERGGQGGAPERLGRDLLDVGPVGSQGVPADLALAFGQRSGGEDQQVRAH